MSIRGWRRFWIVGCASVSTFVVLSLGIDYGLEQEFRGRFAHRVPNLRTGDWFYFDTRLRHYAQSVMRDVAPANVIAFVGDSVTFCHDVSPPASWPGVLNSIAQDYLEADFRILNLGCDGTGIGYLESALQTCLALGVGRVFAVLNPRNHCRWRWPESVTESQIARSYRTDDAFLRPEAVIFDFGNAHRAPLREVLLCKQVVSMLPWLGSYRRLKERMVGDSLQLPARTERSARSSIVPGLYPFAQREEANRRDNQHEDTVVRFHSNTGNLDYFAQHHAARAQLLSFVLPPFNYELECGQHALRRSIMDRTRDRLSTLVQKHGFDAYGRLSELPASLFRWEDDVHLNEIGCWKFAQHLRREIPELARLLPEFEIVTPDPIRFPASRGYRLLAPRSDHFEYLAFPGRSGTPSTTGWKLRSPSGRPAYLEVTVPRRYLGSIEVTPDPDQPPCELASVEVSSPDDGVLFRHTPATMKREIAQFAIRGQHVSVTAAGAKTRHPLPGTGPVTIRIGYVGSGSGDRSCYLRFIASFVIVE